ncbi:MAG: 4,5-dihydroxyphthalate dehydrogenase [Opitutia bacterium Tous-C1TDCM]|nr:MAG: 4,5-dihydroxyphthalate dehydrogenase [Opitutae bacterium Tous-C1TDCM]
MKNYNVGIIGYGWVSTAHIQAINATAHAQVTAVYSSRPQDAAALSARHGSPIQTFTDLAAMLRRPDLHAVAICSYPHQHADHIIAAAQAGKHLIIEKPITLTAEDATRVAAAVKAAGVKTCVCFECRFSSQFQATKAVIDAGLLGAIHYGEVDYYHGIGPWYGQFRWNTGKKDGGSSLLSAGCHALDALLLCMGGNVEAVTSYATRSQNTVFKQYEYATTSVTILRFADGRVGKVASVIDCLQPYYFHTHLVGSEGSLLDNKFHSQKLATNKHAWSGLAMKLLDSGDVSDHPYQTQFEAFFAALQRGEEMPLTNLEESLRSHRVVLAADRSAELGREVKLAELA